MATYQEVVQGLTTRGVPRMAAIGIAGNYVVESGLDTGINEIAPLVEGSRGGYGIGQWTGPRRRQLEAFAGDRGLAIDDLDTQLDFTVWELENTEKAARDAIYSAETPEDAARAVSTRFLRPGIPHLDRRIAAASQIAAGGELNLPAPRTRASGSTISGGGGSDALTGQAAGDNLGPVTTDPAVIERTYQAFINGEMTPENRRAYEADVRSGRMSIPTGMSLYEPIAVEIPQVQDVYDRYIAGQLSDDQRADYESDVRAGVIPLPAGATLNNAAPIANVGGQGWMEQGYDGPLMPVAGPDLPPRDDPSTMGLILGNPEDYTKLPESAGEMDIARGMAADMGGNLVGPALGGVFTPEGSPAAQMMPNAPGVVQGATNAGLAALGGIGAATGYVTGAVGDIAESYGMRPLKARDMAREVAAIPEASAGSPTIAPTRAAQVARRVDTPDPRLAAVAAGEQTGIPVLTSDVLDTQTWAGRWLSNIGEKIPVIGTGGRRAAQADARRDAVQDIVRAYSPNGTRTVDDILGNLSESFIEQRMGRVTQYAEAKGEVIERLTGEAVPVDNFTAAIDEQIARLGRLGTPSANAAAQELTALRAAAQGKDLATLEDLRKQVGDMFTGSDNASVRTLGQSITNSLYGPLRDDMGAFIRTNGERRDYTQWMVANRRLSEMAGDLNIGALRNVLRTGEASPEAIGRLLFSSKTSDVARLYRDLPPEGRAIARQGILQRAFEVSRTGQEGFSATRFETELRKLSRQTGVFFRGDDRETVQGLARALEYTRRADQSAVTVPTGQQAIPFVAGSFLTDILGGMGAATASLGAAGAASRVYESAPVRNALLRLSRARAGSDAERAAFVELQIRLNNQLETIARAEAATREARQPEE